MTRTFTRGLFGGALALALASIAGGALACSTVIVGKDASATGRIIVGHNEDNGGRILSAQYWMPAADHPAGETITFEKAAAKIPQVAHTLGFYWTETMSPTGASFSDGFLNEKGVLVTSNACSGIYDDDMMPLKDGGIGYGIRRLVAERAGSAAEGVEIAIGLLKEFGYFSQGRTYTIADADKAWQIAIHQGDTWVAHKVADDEVVYIPNNFMMDKVDATDTEHWRVAPGTIERAIKNGRYKPAEPGVYKDFNYRVAVAPAARRASEVNSNRNTLAWEYITGKKITDPEAFPYSATPAKKLSVSDVKAILRLHEKEIGDDEGWYHHKSTGVCRATTHESLVVEFEKTPLMIRGWRSMARPCESPFVPFYPLAGPASGAAFLTPQQATADHFAGIPEDFSYRVEWPVWSFIEAANTIDYQRRDIKDTTSLIERLEHDWAKARPSVEARARVLFNVSPEKARSFLNTYNVVTFNEAAAAMREHTARIAPHHMNVLADVIDPASEATVNVVLYSDGTLDATKAVVEKTRCGVGRSSIGNKNVVADLAGVVKSEVKDVDGDGRKDLVLSFRQKDVAFGMLPGAVYDTWLYTWVNGKRICAFDTGRVAAPEKKAAGTDAKDCGCQ